MVSRSCAHYFIDGCGDIVYPTAIGWATSQDEATNSEQFNAWQTIQKSHSVAKRCSCCKCEPCRLRAKRCYEILGWLFRVEPIRSRYLPGFARQGGVHVQDIDLDKTDSYRNSLAFFKRQEDRLLSANHQKGFIDEE